MDNWHNYNYHADKVIIIYFHNKMQFNSARIQRRILLVPKYSYWCILVALLGIFDTACSFLQTISVN